MIRSILAPVVLLVLLSLAWLPLGAQPVGTLQGTPLLQRFLPQDYKASPQHWAIATDRDGRLFVGNSEGVLRYDGEHWDLISLPGRHLARKVVTGQDGRIYVGSYDTFGWLQTTADGETVYRELLTRAGLKGSERNVGNIWQIIATAKGVYFRSENTLHFIDYDQRTARHWPLGENQRAFYAQGEQLYARIEGLGFCRFVDGRFELEPGGATFARQRLLGVIQQPGWRLLVGDETFYRADGTGIRPLPGDAGSPLRGNAPYTVLPLPGGDFVVGALTGEVFFFGRDGQLRERSTLGHFGIVALGTDHEGGLWAATEGDLVRMAMSSPWSSIGAVHGLDGIVFDFEWHDGALWLATTRGIVRTQAAANGKLETRPMPWLDFEGFALASTDGGLLIAHRDGVMVLDTGAKQPRPLLRAESESVRELVPSRFDPDRVYALGERNLVVITRRQGRWQLDFTLPLAGAKAVTLLETGAGELWLGDSRGGPQRWTIDVARQALLRKDVFGAAQGLVLDPRFGSTLYEIDGQIVVVSGKAGFRRVGTRFVADAHPPLTLVDRPDELVVEVTPLGAYAFSRRQMWFRAAGQTAWQPLHRGSPLAAGYSRLRYNQDGVVRVATWYGLLQFDPADVQPPAAPLVLRLEHVTAERADGRGKRRLPASGDATRTEVARGDRLHFRFGMVSMGSRPEFRHLLEGPGLPVKWSSWTDSDLALVAAAPGDYLLKLEARTAGGRNVAPVSFRYRVLPRWHEQWWVRLSGALLILVLAALAIREFVRRRTRRYADANRKLEARIGERTHELEKLNRQLAELAAEDALTGVANRRAMQIGLQREWVRCMDQRLPLSVLMIDVDFFKRYNDTHGHVEGDELLRTIARTLHALHDPARELLARFGGEEFALVLPGVSQADAARRAENIRLAVQGDVDEITISVGVAGFVPTAHGDPVDLLRRADAAMYQAKRAGRNRVKAAEDQPA